MESPTKVLGTPPPCEAEKWRSWLPRLFEPPALSPPRIRDALPHLLVVFVAAFALYAASRALSLSKSPEE